MKALLSLPYAVWPDRDRDLYQDRVEMADSLIPMGAPGWSTRHRQVAILDYGRWLRYCDDTGVDLGTTTPANRAFPERLTSFFALERSRIATTTLATLAGNILGLLIAMEPHHDWTWLRSAYAYLNSRAARHPVTKAMVVHAADLFSLGIELISSSLTEDSTTIVDPIAYRDGLIIAMMTAAPARISNFATVQIGQQLVHDIAGWCLRFTDEETKEDKFDEWPLPDGLGPYLEVYIQHVRPALVGTASITDIEHALWIDNIGAPMSAQTMRKRIKERTSAKFNKAILPHSFRKSAATTFVFELPEQAIKVSALLNHGADGRVTEKHYIVAQRQLAVRTWHVILDRRREVARKATRQRRSGT